MTTEAEINREIDRLWNKSLEHKTIAHDAYMTKLGCGGYGDAGMERSARQADRVMKQHERASRKCLNLVNVLGALRRKLFGR